jgi:hypothetical protein
VLERVRGPPEAAVRDPAHEEVRSHATRSVSRAAIAAAASYPERQPSSWKP